MEKINVKDKNGNDIYFGDELMVTITDSIFAKETKVKVVKDDTSENIECGRNYDLEDAKGNRIWNALLAIKSGYKINQNEKRN